MCGWKSASAITLIKNQFYPINRVCSFGPLSHSAVEFLLSAAAARAEEMLLLTLIYRLEFSQRPRRASESVVEEAAVHVHHLCVDDYCFMGKTTQRDRETREYDRVYYSFPTKTRSQWLLCCSWKYSKSTKQMHRFSWKCHWNETVRCRMKSNQNRPCYIIKFRQSE